MNVPAKTSLRSVLETVNGMIAALEQQKVRLAEGAGGLAESLAEIESCQARLADAVDRLRATGGSVEAGPAARTLKAELEKRFMLAFRLTRENEELLKRSDAPRGAGAASSGGARPGLREIERRYRERMRPGPASDGATAP